MVIIIKEHTVAPYRAADLLQCVVGDGTRAEVVDVVQAGEDPRAAGAGDRRQVAGGPALDALALVVLQVVVLGLLAPRHSLRTPDDRGLTLFATGALPSGGGSARPPWGRSAERPHQFLDRVPQRLLLADHEGHVAVHRLRLHNRKRNADGREGGLP